MFGWGKGNFANGKAKVEKKKKKRDKVNFKQA